MRKVLIVSPNFPPKSTADLHRVRTSLPYFRKFGWAPTVLCVAPEFCEGIDDPLLAESIPDGIDIVRVAAWREKISRVFGFGQLDYRAFLPLYRAGNKLMSESRYDVVYFSTTLFLTFLLGPLWKRRFGCKIVFDFHDPWYTEESSYTRQNVPGVWWKYNLSRLIAKKLEPVALRSADHIVSVSKGYVRMFMKRYDWLLPSCFSVIPFGAEEEDYAFARRRGIQHGMFSSEERPIRWVSIGAIVPDMIPILTVFFEKLAELKKSDPAFSSRLRIYFVGSSYAPAGRSNKMVEDLAREHGVGDLLREYSERVPYFHALSLYADSDAIVLIGTASADYTASKLFGCVLAYKPILAMFHKNSLMGRVAPGFSNVFVAPFTTPSEVQFERTVSEGIAWLQRPVFDPSTIKDKIAPWAAETLTQAQCAIFDRVHAA